MYKYETHLHTAPVSKCARVSVEDNLIFYKNQGYDGVFITNHFLDGNINLESRDCYEEGIEFYFSDYEKGLEIGKDLGIKVFCGVELSLHGTDFLVYGLDKAWYLAHPEIMQMKKSQELQLMMDSGALVVQAHPYREAGYIDHIRLFPRYVHAVEIVNASQSEFGNRMAQLYAENYGLLPFAGSDNHRGPNATALAGMCSEVAVVSELDFVRQVKEGIAKPFYP